MISMAHTVSRSGKTSSRNELVPVLVEERLDALSRGRGDVGAPVEHLGDGRERNTRLIGEFLQLHSRRRTIRTSHRSLLVEFVVTDNLWMWHTVA
jgi:hypothetical protein